MFREVKTSEIFSWKIKSYIFVM